MPESRVWKNALLIAMLVSGCATQKVPVGVQCNPFPTPPAQLMTPPAISDYAPYYDTLKTQQID